MESCSLDPARWIWLPSQRTLPASFVLFRRGFTIGEPLQARALITADSRYRLTVNGRYAGWGPAPCDPRTLDVDPIDVTHLLHEGENQIDVEVLFYGHGDGTWVYGKPGLIFKLDCTCREGGSFTIVSDARWECAPNPVRPPGRAERWYLRALQEVADLRARPTIWIPAMELDAPADRPPICSSYRDYLTDISVADRDSTRLVLRSIPPMTTRLIDARPTAVHHVHWKRDPSEWFDFRVPDSFRITSASDSAIGPDGVTVPVPADPADGFAATWDLGEQYVGWPYVEIDAPAGTVVDIMLQEAHDQEGPAWLDTHLYRWLRFTCSAGRSRFEAFDFDSVRWLQVHVRGHREACHIRAVGLRARTYPFAFDPEYSIGDPAIATVIDACVNTVRLSAQETVVDCMGRERQQYSGDIGHELLAVMAGFGETAQPARFLRTFSQGATRPGYFMDSWPGVDRVNRIPQRMLGFTEWGVILDHSLQFIHDCRAYHLHSGDAETVTQILPRLLPLLGYLEESFDDDVGLPVEHLDIPIVWIDHDAYTVQRHKSCAYQLAAAAALRHGLAPLATQTHADASIARRAERLADRLIAVAHRRFWCPIERTFVVNRPWLDAEGDVRYCDRSLATAILYGFCPDGDTDASVTILDTRPPSMGYSYVPNQYWRHRALVRSGRVATILNEYRTEWAAMDSVRRNRTISEHWSPAPDTASQYSHAGVVPLIVLYLDIAGIQPTSPGYDTYTVQPCLGDIPSFTVSYRTPHGAIVLSAVLDTSRNEHEVTIQTPAGGRGTLIVPAAARLEGSSARADRNGNGSRSTGLPPGGTTVYRVPARGKPGYLI